MFWIISIAFIALFICFPLFRCSVLHPILLSYYLPVDLRDNFVHKRSHEYKSGDLNIYCGYFGSGKTLSLVHKVSGIYNRYNGLQVWDDSQDKFVVQRILVLSNVNLSIPYVPLESLAQVVAVADANKQYDREHGTLTSTVVCMDELSVQMNSRSFKDNIDAYFLNTLMCCRHYHISFYGSAQRFAHVDKLMRDVTMSVIQCRKIWRFQLNTYYDAWEMENATNPEMIKPLSRHCWFVRNSDYAAYDTLAVVQNLKKKYDSNDILTEQEILANQNPTATNMDVVSHPSRKYLKSKKTKH